MASGSITPDAFHNVKNDLARLTVVQLKSVVRNDNLALSGTKSSLQDRIKQRIDEYYGSNDVHGFNRIRGYISNATRSTSMGSFNGLASSPSNSLPSHQNMVNGSNRGPSHSPPSSSSYNPVRLNFKDSPFYTIEMPLTRIEQTKGADSSRATFELKFKLSPDVAARFSRDSMPRDGLRIMVFCAVEPVSTFVRPDIAFPNQIEMRVNGTEVRSNFRGLKNRPGSTRPADITDMLRKTQNYENSLTVAYALSHKKYYFVVNLVKQVPVERLVRRLQDGKSISREQVIREMMSKAQDTDLEATSTVMSLKCPLSTLRMETPCRSNICTHNQCFDALSFLQLQQQGPTWMCPVCNRTVTFEALQVDQYVNEILNLTPHTVEQIAISPSGEWSVVEQGDSKTRPHHPGGSDEDELIEIPDATVDKDPAGYKAIASSSSFHSQTPMRTSREESTVSGPAQSSSGKRPHSAVIDLTLDSDEEEDERIRGPKRIAHNPPNATKLPSLGMNATSFNGGSQDAFLRLGMPRPDASRPPTMNYDYSRT